MTEPLERATAHEPKAPPWWERLLLPEHHPSNLAIQRIILGGYYMFFLWERRRSFTRVATRSDPEIFEPVGIVSGLTHPIDPQLYLALYGACQISAVLFTFGLLYRVAGPLFGLLMLFLLTYRQCFGFIYHTDNLMALHAMVLGFAPAAHVLSLDRRLLERGALGATSGWQASFGRLATAFMQAGPKVPTASWRYGWPAQLMLLGMGVAYWVAGMAKIGRSGLSLDWVSQAHLFQHVGDNALRYEFLAGGALPITGAIFALPAAVIIALSAGSLLMELSAPLLVVPGVVRALIGFGIFCFHYGVLLVMGIPFHYQLRGFAFVPLVRWDLVLARLRPRLKRLFTHGD